MNIQGWYPLGRTGLISLQSKGLSWIFSNTTVQKQAVWCDALLPPQIKPKNLPPKLTIFQSQSASNTDWHGGPTWDHSEEKVGSSSWGVILL